MTQKNVQFDFTKGTFWLEDVYGVQGVIYFKFEFAQIAFHKVLKVKSKIARKFINEIENW